jgi:hypothetical protein
MGKKIGKYWYGLFRDGQLIETQQTDGDKGRAVATLFMHTQYFLDTGAVYEIAPVKIVTRIGPKRIRSSKPNSRLSVVE